MAKPAVKPWFEITGKDGAALQRFYSTLFDWTIQDPGNGFGIVQPSENGIGGNIGPSRDGGPGQVTFYVEVDDVAAYLQKAEALGGKTIIPPTEVPYARVTFAFFADPEGHVVGLSKGPSA